MDRKLLKQPFNLKHNPDWECPTCQKGTLKIDPKTFHSGEKLRSRDHSHDAWDPEWIEYVYSTLLHCTNPACKETVASSGTGSVEPDVVYDENGMAEFDYDDYFRPKYFEPPLQIVRFTPEAPPSVLLLLDESFRLFFSSPTAALNQVRIATEQLLTELGIKRFVTANGKRRAVSLHSRIALLPNKYANAAEMILAIKWLGNAGSHAPAENVEITMDDVVDAYEFLDHVLQELYPPSKAEALKKKAKLVNRKKGPVRR